MVAYGTAALCCTLICFCLMLASLDVSVVSSSVSGHEGGNISVKCLYSSVYKNKHKQWCRYKDKSCYTSQSSSVQISHDERESFTVLMSGLMLSDSGWYFCSVENFQAPVQLTVTAPPDVSVVSSSVSGHEGGNISVKCLYSSAYKNKHKQWCRYKDKSCFTSQSSSVQISDDERESFTVLMSGLMLSDSGCKYLQQRKFWSTEADNRAIFTNFTSETLSVIDYPAQSLFTVTMRNLKMNQNGGFYCFVETYEGNKTTYEASLDVSVVSSSVSGHEGGNISVKCLYSSAYKNKHKQWCRYKDKSCYTSQNSSVQISDDERESFTVLMSGLMLSDSGWYFCSVENFQAPVKLTVNVSGIGPDLTTDNNTETTKCSEHWDTKTHYYKIGGTVTILCLYDSRYKLNIHTELGNV
ncbi:hypothetical protein E1301_Tti015990 [Triplophysa tibetana]|uniref:Ig-like domain-containing protein n=1 Tax=Triplophysa tibetana TaxID=1572043 RepID=A0A5A9PC58_9TELE|nr:hypothetical protein E1301_Tti015990 [Triplophysa tibetana]